MSFTLNIAVSIGVSEIFGVYIKYFIVQYIQYVHTRQATSSMSGFCFVNVFENIFLRNTDFFSNSLSDIIVLSSW